MVKLERLKGSFKFASEGWRFALKNDQNLRIHILISLLVFFFSWYYSLSRSEFVVILLLVVFVISSELMNTAVEKTVDLITTEHRLEAKFAKDVSSAMVLTSAIGALVIGLIIFVPHIIH
jgi:diacylglycerol kinase